MDDALKAKYPWIRDFNEDGQLNVFDLVKGIALGADHDKDYDVEGSKEGSGAMEVQDLSPSLLTANPLPSMPSISNVGASPFTGTVNWNAIAGGFQPLPQVAGSSKKLYQLSQFHGGMNQKSSSRDISDQECEEATNITFSQIGRIKMLGNITGTDSGLETGDLASSATHIPSPGYGLYVFKSGYSLEESPTQGDYTIVASTDGEHVVVKDSTAEKTDADTWLTISNEATDVAPVFYASGNGLYVCDANLAHTATRKAAMLVYRKDINGSVEVKGWKTGEALLGTPTVHSSNADGVELKASHSHAGAAGRLEVYIEETGTGNWDGTYNFYVSWLFDNGCETGLSSLGSDTFSNQQCVFNVSIQHTNTNPLGGDKRIHGARIYFRKSGSVEKYLLSEVSLPDGVKGSVDSTFTPWDNPTGTTYDLASDITFDSPPEIYTYVSLNGFYETELYDADDTSSPRLSHDVRYRTATVASNGSTFIGCYMYRGKVFKDGMMYSMPNKPAVFPEYNVYDSPSSDGTPITVLASFQDKVLQFKQDALYIINISNPSQFYTQASFRNCGVMNPCQVFETPFGVIFANYIGCFIYDGQKVISLTSGKFTDANWGLSEGSIVDTASGKDAINVPCVGYDPRSQSIIVLKDIGHTVDNDSAWIYHMGTQSWTESSDMIANADGVRHSNFVVSPNGYLSICQSDVEVVKNYKLGNSAQTLLYQTKDLDFGLPTQTKKLHKVYITYRGNATNLTVTWRYNGETVDRGFTATNFGDNSGTDDYEVATLIPDNTAESKDWKSMAIRITSGASTVASDFEINDISILYRVRPIK